jgi:hypothetical protein
MEVVNPQFNASGLSVFVVSSRVELRLKKSRREALCSVEVAEAES